MPSAEAVYVFRHAVLRDAGYRLQLPGDRAALHALAFDVLESLYGGRAPNPPPPGSSAHRPPEPHGTDPVALELSVHAHRAAELSRFNASRDHFPPLRRLYLRRAAEHAERLFHGEEAIAHWEALAALLEGRESGRALLRAARVASRIGRLLFAGPLLERVLGVLSAAGDTAGLGSALEELTSVYDATGRRDEAEAHCRSALKILREAGDRRGEGSAGGPGSRPAAFREDPGGGKNLRARAPHPAGGRRPAGAGGGHRKSRRDLSGNRAESRSREDLP